MSLQTTIVLADDHTVVRHGLRMLLECEAEVRVVAEADTVHDALRLSKAHRPDILVLDLFMPPGPGGRTSLEIIELVREATPATHVVILTMQDDVRFVRRAMASGASAYVLKESADTELVNAITLARRGDVYVHPRLGAELATAVAEPDGPPDGLTERELGILRLVALGYSSREIAAKLYLSVRTVETHRVHLQRKLGITGRAGLTRYALHHDLLTAAG